MWGKSACTRTKTRKRLQMAVSVHPLPLCALSRPFLLLQERDCFFWGSSNVAGRRPAAFDPPRPRPKGLLLGAKDRRGERCWWGWYWGQVSACAGMRRVPSDPFLVFGSLSSKFVGLGLDDARRKTGLRPTSRCRPNKNGGALAWLFSILDADVVKGEE